MGQIKNLTIKNMARNLIEKYPDKFTTDYEKNKEEMEKLVILESKKIRNMIAGYIVHIIRKRSRPQKFEVSYQVKQVDRRRRQRRR
ncbi:MAG: 30S ribosomal protein S17e [Candidatus Aenigmarchaeota archaeon]|nr:30S ribosomal protein S17e [Candidatus Aenigmarchaeota archaeon]